MIKVGILGAGTWGIALAQMLSEYCNVVVWSAIDSEIDNLSRTRTHPNLKNVKLAKNIVYTKELDAVCSSEYIILAVPSVYMAEVVEKITSYVDKTKIIVNVSKGLESKSGKTMSQVIRRILGNNFNNIVTLSGPTHAEEVVARLLTTIVAASDNMAAAEQVQKLFTNSILRVYTNPDIIGVELCGSIKNIIALASGISKGLGYGDNARAALITRGCAEIRRLGLKMGCMSQTFYGLAGIGDLIVTASSTHSRNNKAGYYIGQGMSVNEAISKVGMVVEGINAIKPVIDLSNKYCVDMPIVSAVNDVVYNNIKPDEIVYKLFNRTLKSEIEK